MKNSLNHSIKNAFITGGGSGLGLKISDRLKSLGYNIGITYHNSKIDKKNFAFAEQVDLTSTPITSSITSFINQFGSIDLFIHNASIFALETMQSPSLDLTPNFNIHAKTTLDSVHHLYHYNKKVNQSTKYISILDGEVVSTPNIEKPNTKNLDMLEIPINLHKTKFLSYYITKRMIIDIISVTSNDVKPYIMFKSLFPVQIQGLESEVCERTKKGHHLEKILSVIP